MTNLESVLKSIHYFADKDPCSQSYDFLAVMYGVRVGLQRKLRAEELMLLNCDVGETFESPLDCKQIKPVHPKGNQS